VQEINLKKKLSIGFHCDINCKIVKIDIPTVYIVLSIYLKVTIIIIIIKID